MAFLAIVMVALIVTAIMESEFVEEMEIKQEIDRMAEWSRKNPFTNRKRYLKYSKVYNPVLRMGGNAK